jgi:hypothetical protein
MRMKLTTARAAIIKNITSYPKTGSKNLENIVPIKVVAANATKAAVNLYGPTLRPKTLLN